jgi:hypothetical protein
MRRARLPGVVKNEGKSAGPVAADCRASGGIIDPNLKSGKNEKE